MMAAVLALLPAAHAAAADVPGCKDQTLFNRMPGYSIQDCEVKQFDEISFPTRPHAECSAPEVKLEGRIQRFDYRLDDGRTAASALQIQRNFVNAVRAAGGTVVAEGSAMSGNAPLCREGTTRDRAALFKLNRGGREVWAFLTPYDGGDGYELHLVERQAMAQDIAAADLLGAIRQSGRATLPVLFDTAQATIKPESQAQLDQAAQMLKQAPELKIEVGGHTDNAGTPEGNLKLSQARAASVVQALVARGIAAARLSAKGYGQSVPVADNRSEDGRAKNRRVELVRK